MKIILMVFLKEILLYSEQFGRFETKMVQCRFHFESALRFFLLILLKKRDQEVHENVFSCFLRKNLFWGNLIFSSHFIMFDWVWSKLSQATVTIGSLKSQDMINILKQSGHDFLSKRLCGRQCTKILYDVCVWRSIFNIGAHGFKKNLL